MRLTTAPRFLEIPFTGTRSGAFPLTWGQSWVWNSVVSRAPYYDDLSGSYVVAVPDGYNMVTVSNALAAILNRYETFRSRYSIATDGTPRQVVLAEGSLRVEVRDVEAADAQQAAMAAEDQFNRLPFTLPEQSLRAAVIASDGVPKFVVLCAFHMAMDCHGMVSVLDDFRSFMSGRPVGAIPHAPGKISHPVDRALEEQSTDGIRRSTRGVEYWEQELAKFPDDPLPYGINRPETPRYKTFAMYSAAVRVASLQLADELRVSTASVVLALTASLLGRKSGNRVFGIVMTASQRYNPDAMQYPGTLVQGVPVAIDVSHTSSRKLVSQTHRAGMLAALAGHCHHDDLADMLQKSYGQSAQARLACAANLNLPATIDTKAADSIGVTGAEVERLLVESRYEYVEGTSVENERLYLAAHGDPADFFITLRADTAVFNSADIVQFLRDLERSILDCALYSIGA